MKHRIFLPWSTVVLLTFGLLGAVGCSRNRGGQHTLQIKGSDTMVNLGQAWAEEYMKLHPETSIAVTGGGSGTGITAMINNTCDIAEVSREMKAEEIQAAERHGVRPREFKVALDGLVVVVHPANPVSRLTIDELSAIFTGRIRNWRELGGNDLSIVILSREVNSGTHVYFKEHVLRRGRGDGREEFAPEALLLPSSQALADEIAQNPGAIGYFGMGYLSPRQKAVAIAKDKNSPYVAPTVEHILDNTYPISRPLLMYTKGEPQGLTRTFLDFALSPAGQKIVTTLDFVPVRQI